MQPVRRLSGVDPLEHRNGKQEDRPADRRQEKNRTDRRLLLVPPRGDQPETRASGAT